MRLEHGGQPPPEPQAPDQTRLGRVQVHHHRPPPFDEATEPPRLIEHPRAGASLRWPPQSRDARPGEFRGEVTTVRAGDGDLPATGRLVETRRDDAPGDATIARLGHM